MDGVGDGSGVCSQDTQLAQMTWAMQTLQAMQALALAVTVLLVVVVLLLVVVVVVLVLVVVVVVVVGMGCLLPAADVVVVPNRATAHYCTLNSRPRVRIDQRFSGQASRCCSMRAEMPWCWNRCLGPDVFDRLGSRSMCMRSECSSARSTRIDHIEGVIFTMDER
jgi:hypothetical protein